MKKCFTAGFVVILFFAVGGDLFSQESASHIITITILPVNSRIITPGIKSFEEISRKDTISDNVVNKVTVSISGKGVTGFRRITVGKQSTDMSYARDFGDFPHAEIMRLNKVDNNNIPMLFTLLDSN